MAYGETERGLSGEQSPRTIAQSDLLTPLQGRISLSPPSVWHRITVGIAFTFTVGLLCVYAALLAFLAAVALHDAVLLLQSIFGGRRGRKDAGMLLFFGSIGLLFLLKPLLAPRQESKSAVALTLSKEPLLRDFVSSLSNLVGAPTPEVIEIDCELQAAASLSRRAGPMAGGGLVLTLGLPFLAGLDLRGFAGVLAHELGHFSQSTGMRLTSLLWGIQLWLTNAVYKRDAWDEALFAFMAAGGLPGKLLGSALLLATWIFRGVFWALLWGVRICNLLLRRRMEMVAVRFAVAVAGSRSFHEGSETLRVLHLAFLQAMDSIRDSWMDERVPEDFPSLVMFHYRQIPDEVRRQLAADPGRRGPHRLDPRHSGSQLARASYDEDSKGKAFPEIPATALFENLKSLSRRATLAFYRKQLGITPTAEQLLENYSFLQIDNTRLAEKDSLDRFSGGLLDPRRPPFLIEEAGRPSTDLLCDTKALLEAREDLRWQLPEARGISSSLRAVQDRLGSVKKAQVAIQNGLEIPKDEISRLTGVFGELGKTRAYLESQYRDLREKLMPTSALVLRRLTLGIRLACTPGVLKVPGDLPSLIACHTALSKAFPTLLNLADSFESMGFVMAIFRQAQDQRLTEAVRFAVGGWSRMLRELHSLLAPVPHPFAPEGKGTSIARHAIEPLPKLDDIGEHELAVEDAIEKLNRLIERVLGHLGAIVEMVEAAVEHPLDT